MLVNYDAAKMDKTPAEFVATFNATYQKALSDYGLTPS